MSVVSPKNFRDSNNVTVFSNNAVSFYLNASFALKSAFLKAKTKVASSGSVTSSLVVYPQLPHGTISVPCSKSNGSRNGNIHFVD